MELNSVGKISSQMNYQQGAEPSTSYKEAPSSKLELIEKFLNATKSCELTASAHIASINSTTSTASKKSKFMSNMIFIFTPTKLIRKIIFVAL